MGRDDRAYLLARAIQFFLPGVPQVYYVGLLAGENDMTLLARNGVGRDINRHHYSRDEIGAALTRPVVQALIELIRTRNTHPAFGGAFRLEPGDDDARLSIRWALGEHTAQLQVDFSTLEYQLNLSA